MCGRFTISKKIGDLAERFNVEVEEAIYSPVFNAAPGQNLPVIISGEQNKLLFFRWGLVPFWAKNSSEGYKMINARGEGIMEKSSFKKLMERKRCLVPADGFYEWKKNGKNKTPFRFCLNDNSLFAFAGLWDSWKDNNNTLLHSFTIITTAANELILPVHDRMPVILSQETEHLWLSENAEINTFLPLLQPFPAHLMKGYPVSELVGNPRNNFPELIEEVK